MLVEPAGHRPDETRPDVGRRRCRAARSARVASSTRAASVRTAAQRAGIERLERLPGVVRQLGQMAFSSSVARSAARGRPRTPCRCGGPAARTRPAALGDRDRVFRRVSRIAEGTAAPAASWAACGQDVTRRSERAAARRCRAARAVPTWSSSGRCGTRSTARIAVSARIRMPGGNEKPPRVTPREAGRASRCAGSASGGHRGLRAQCAAHVVCCEIGRARAPAPRAH